MPSSWNAEALKAQAVAARSTALAAGGHCSWFGTSVMCRDTRDQVYGGQGGEAASTNAAIDATAGKVLASGGASPRRSSSRRPAAGPRPSTTSGARRPFVPDQRERSVRQHLAAPHLGPAGLRGRLPADSGPRLRLVGPGPSSGRSAVSLRSSIRTSPSPIATAPAAWPRPGSSGRAARTRSRARRSGQELGLRSTWFSVGAPP